MADEVDYERSGTGADGFVEAFCARPERLPGPAARLAQSARGVIGAAAGRRAVAVLRRDLEYGARDRRPGALRSQPEYASSLRLITAWS